MSEQKLGEIGDFRAGDRAATAARDLAVSTMSDGNRTELDWFGRDILPFHGASF